MARVDEQRLIELERKHQVALGWTLDEGNDIIDDLRDERQANERLRAAVKDLRAALKPHHTGGDSLDCATCKLLAGTADLEGA